MPETNVKGFFLYFDQCEPLDELSDEQCGQLMRAMLAKFQGKDFEFTDPTVRVVFRFFEKSFLQEQEKYKQICEKRRENIKKRWDTNEHKNIQDDTNEYKSIQNDTKPIQSHTNDTINQKPEPELKPELKQEERGAKAPSPARTRVKFSPPSVEEVAAYCRQRNNGINPQQFVDYYTAQGWKLSNGRVMCDWQAAVRTWESRGSYRPSLQQQPRAKPGEFDMARQRQIANQVLAEMEAEDALRQQAG